MRILLLFLASFSCLVFLLEYIEPGIWRRGDGETILSRKECNANVWTSKWDDDWEWNIHVSCSVLLEKKVDAS